MIDKTTQGIKKKEKKCIVEKKIYRKEIWERKFI